MDHVVGRAFFLTQPTNHLTVPCCEACNRSFAMDEEYVRNVFCMSRTAKERNAVAAGLCGTKVARSLQRNPRLAQMLWQSITMTTQRFAGGIIVPNQPQMNADASRVHCVMEKITRGLYYSYVKRPLAKDAFVGVDTTFTSQDDWNRWRDLISKASRFGTQGYPGEVFVVNGAWDTNDPGASSVWLMSFYNRYPVLTVTARPGVKQICFTEQGDKKPIAGISLAA